MFIDMQEGRWATAVIKAVRQAAPGSGRRISQPGGLVTVTAGPTPKRLGFSWVVMGPENLHFFQVLSHVMLLV